MSISASFATNCYAKRALIPQVFMKKELSSVHQWFPPKCLESLSGWLLAFIGFVVNLEANSKSIKVSCL